MPLQAALGDVRGLRGPARSRRIGGAGLDGHNGDAYAVAGAQAGQLALGDELANAAGGNVQGAGRLCRREVDFDESHAKNPIVLFRPVNAIFRMFAVKPVFSWACVNKKIFTKLKKTY